MSRALVAAAYPRRPPSVHRTVTRGHRFDQLCAGASRFRSREHQPHPPGSPVYIALGRALLTLVSSSGLRSASHRERDAGLWSLVAAARVVAGRAVRPSGAAATAAASGRRRCWQHRPLFWLSGLRPMSDLPGLAAALVAQALILEGRKDRNGCRWRVGKRRRRRYPHADALSDRSAPRDGADRQRAPGGAGC